MEELHETPTSIADVPPGVTTIFSPRSGSAVLDMYAKMVDDAERLSSITLAFGISDVFKNLLGDNTPQSPIAFFLLEKEDKPNPRSKKRFVGLNAANNVYKAWGSYLREPLFQWTRETNAGGAQTQQARKLHSFEVSADGPRFRKDPIVGTGSANFSKASTNDNDENMLVIRGDQRVADIYFTEFNRLFYHYYFRSIQETTRRPAEDEKAHARPTEFLLEENDDWIKKYKRGSLKRKRVEIFAQMEGFA